MRPSKIGSAAYWATAAVSKSGNREAGSWLIANTRVSFLLVTPFGGAIGSWSAGTRAGEADVPGVPVDDSPVPGVLALEADVSVVGVAAEVSVVDVAAAPLSAAVVVVATGFAPVSVVAVSPGMAAEVGVPAGALFVVAPPQADSTMLNATVSDAAANVSLFDLIVRKISSRL